MLARLTPMATLDMSELRTCAKCVGGLAVTTLPWWAPRSFIRPCLHA